MVDFSHGFEISNLRFEIANPKMESGDKSPHSKVQSSHGEQRIIVVKRSAVSTGRLRRLRALHLRPIDLVVFQEPSDLAVIET